MTIVRKIAAAIVMLISGLLLLAFLAGVAGVWMVRGDALQLVNDVANLADHSVQRARNGVAVVQTGVAMRQTRLTGAITNIQTAGDKIEQNSVALAAAEQLLNKDLTPAVQQMSAQAAEIRDTIAFIDDTIAVMQRLPFGKQKKMLTLADNVIERIKQVGQNIEEVTQNISTVKVQMTTNAVQALTAPLERANNALQNVSDDLAQLDTRLADSQAQIEVLRTQISTAITIVAIGLSVGFLWLAVANLALLVHAWGLFTGRDPLARWHKAGQPA